MKEEIFKYINPDNNDKLSKMKGIDLQYLLILIDYYYITLRDSLGFNNYVTFGLELEFENAMRARISKKLVESLLNESWVLKTDASLHNGAEINSPILKDTKDNWKDLNTVCDIVSPNAVIGKRAGGTHPCWYANTR